MKRVQATAAANLQQVVAALTLQQGVAKSISQRLVAALILQQVVAALAALPTALTQQVVANAKTRTSYSMHELFQLGKLNCNSTLARVTECDTQSELAHPHLI
jgi:hypothetical protein